MDKNTTKTMFSKATDEWETPQKLYDKLDSIFHFTLDPCATDLNHKCSKYYTKDDDGLVQDWQGETCFVNNPYSNSKMWTKKCAEEGKKDDTLVALLLPARTETSYFQANVFPGAQAILFIKGRLKFGGHKNSAPFPSVVAFFSDVPINPSQVKELKTMGSVVIPI